MNVYTVLYDKSIVHGTKKVYVVTAKNEDDMYIKIDRNEEAPIGGFLTKSDLKIISVIEDIELRNINIIDEGGERNET